LHTGGELESPAVDLVRAARDAGKLEDLSQRVEKLAAKTETAQRNRLALVVLIRLEQGRDADAAEALKQMLPLLKKVPPGTAFRDRWPELLAASQGLTRPAVLPAAVPILQQMVDQVVQNGTKRVQAEGEQDWARYSRHELGRARMLASGV